MKQSEINELSMNDLLERLESEKKQLVKLKINHAVTPIENPNKIKEYRKTIARFKTEICKRNNQSKTKAL
ncbi:MAG: 50S ribosomal protein L29 [Bacteroidota bacterium]|jgi:large subunit ribosomal protein L29